MNSIETRQHLFDTMVINQNIVDNNHILVPNIPHRVDARVQQMISNKDRYVSIAKQFSNKFLRWHVVALIHEMEAEQNFSKYLGNGQSLDRVTTIVPKGRGPFASFEDGAKDAIKLDGLNNKDLSTIGNLLYVLEGFNGYGYEMYHNMPSPYLWSGSNNYVRGKYTNDGKWSSNAVSSQIGIALMLKRLMELNTVSVV